MQSKTMIIAKWPSLHTALVLSAMLLQHVHGFGGTRRPIIDTSILRQYNNMMLVVAKTRLQMVTNIPNKPMKDKEMDMPSDDPKWQFDESSFNPQSTTEAEEENNNAESAVVPRALKLVQDSFMKLPSGSDIRGSFLNHGDISVSSAANALKNVPQEGVPAPLTPLAAFCMGYAFAKMVATRSLIASNDEKSIFTSDNNDTATSAPRICIGRDPRPHGSRLADGFARGAKAFGAHVKDTRLASTPAMFEFCRSNKCDGAVMVTASHLPTDRNGFKLFTGLGGGFSKDEVKCLINEAKDCAASLFFESERANVGSGSFERVNYMPHYAGTLRRALINEICDGMTECSPILLPLAGLRIVLNAGHGAGWFFNDVLHELGADVTNSVGVQSDPTFPNGIPNPEDPKMVEITKTACENCNADIGIMLDTDADRCGFIVPRFVEPSGCSMYEPLNRNRLIAFLGVIFSQTSPGCTIVTDSCTSEGLERFLEETLGLHHERYLKGYANVIGKAKELSESGKANAEVAIETSGHCAMKENGYLDDGTYTAVKVIGCLAKLARERLEVNGGHHRSLLELISELPEMAEVRELRLNVLDGTLDTTSRVFDDIVRRIHRICIDPTTQQQLGWQYDDKNLEGVRAKIGNDAFFMIRKSLHDPIISIQLEGLSRDHLSTKVIRPLIDIFRLDMNLDDVLDISTLQTYTRES